jgi:hypothetical protein
MKCPVTLGSQGSFRCVCVFAEKLLMEPLRQHPQDLYRVIRIVLMHRLSAHDS